MSTEGQELKYTYKLTEEEYQKETEGASRLKLGCNIIAIVVSVFLGWVIFYVYSPTGGVLDLIFGGLVAIIGSLTMLRISAKILGGVKVDQERVLITTDEKIYWNDISAEWNWIQSAKLNKTRLEKFNLLLRTRYKNPQTGTDTHGNILILDIESLGNTDEILLEISNRISMSIENWTPITE